MHCPKTGLYQEKICQYAHCNLRNLAADALPPAMTMKAKTNLIFVAVEGMCYEKYVGIDGIVSIVYSTRYKR